MKVKNATTGEEFEPYAVLTIDSYWTFHQHLSNLLHVSKEPVGKRHPESIRELSRIQLEIMLSCLTEARAVVRKSRKKADKA